MGLIRILSESEIRRLVKLDLNAVSCVEQAFGALAGGGVVMPPVLSLDIAEFNGEVDVKTAYVPGLDSFAIKMSPGFFDNPKLGLPSLNGLMVEFCARTGIVKTLLLDNGYLTAVRTAAAGAVAAKYLSRKEATHVAVFGSGEQARLQLQALLLVRPISSACYWSRDFSNAKHTAREMSRLTGIDITAEPDPSIAARGADIIVCCTPAKSPIIKADWLKPGQHITAMGSDAENKNELQPQIISQSDLYVPDSLAQTRCLGELHHALDAGLVNKDDEFAELGAIISGKAAGRTQDNFITIADLTGTGVQDTAIANLAGSLAHKKNAGFIINPE